MERQRNTDFVIREHTFNITLIKKICNTRGLQYENVAASLKYNIIPVNELAKITGKSKNTIFTLSNYYHKRISLNNIRLTIIYPFPETNFSFVMIDSECIKFIKFSLL